MNTRRRPTAWLSYGAGVNSTAVLVLLADGKFDPGMPFRVVFADTQDEKDQTYEYLYQHAMPYARRHGITIEVVRDCEGVLERWQRLGVTGSRTMRTCSVHSKVEPIGRHIDAHGLVGDVQLIGIHAGEAHRKGTSDKDRYPKRFPLIELDLDQEGCVAAIEIAGLPVPPKSGCWHCPFARRSEIVELCLDRPDRARVILNLERASLEKHPLPPGIVRAHWHDKPVEHWMERACATKSSGELFQGVDPDPPCVCMDG